jgi:hypothetical protein
MRSSAMATTLARCFVYTDAKAVGSANAIYGLAYAVPLDFPLGKERYTQHDCNERYNALDDAYHII